MNLGIVLTPNGQIPGGVMPYGIAYGYGNGGQGYLNEGDDAQYNTRGEPGYYHDSPLGGLRGNFLQRWQARRAMKRLNGLGASIPNDFQLAYRGNYLPMNNGWIVTTKGAMTPGWIPPSGWTPGHQFDQGQLSGSGFTCLGLGCMGLMDVTPGSTPASPTAPATADDVLAAMNQQNAKLFTLAIISTTAVAISAFLTIYRTRSLLKRGA